MSDKEKLFDTRAKYFSETHKIGQTRIVVMVDYCFYCVGDVPSNTNICLKCGYNYNKKDTDESNVKALNWRADDKTNN